MLAYPPLSSPLWCSTMNRHGRTAVGGLSSSEGWRVNRTTWCSRSDPTGSPLRADRAPTPLDGRLAATTGVGFWVGVVVLAVGRRCGSAEPPLQAEVRRGAAARMV